MEINEAIEKLEEFLKEFYEYQGYMDIGTANAIECLIKYVKKIGV